MPPYCEEHKCYYEIIWVDFREVCACVKCQEKETEK
jgi:hypothetical protein